MPQKRTVDFDCPHCLDGSPVTGIQTYTYNGVTHRSKECAEEAVKAGVDRLTVRSWEGSPHRAGR